MNVMSSEETTHSTTDLSLAGALQSDASVRDLRLKRLKHQTHLTPHAHLKIKTVYHLHLLNEREVKI